LVLWCFGFLIFWLAGWLVGWLAGLVVGWLWGRRIRRDDRSHRSKSFHRQYRPPATPNGPRLLKTETFAFPCGSGDLAATIKARNPVTRRSA
jgi:hypothetical protein